MLNFVPPKYFYVRAHSNLDINPTYMVVNQNILYINIVPPDRLCWYSQTTDILIKAFSKVLPEQRHNSDYEKLFLDDLRKASSQPGSTEFDNIIICPTIPIQNFNFNHKNDEVLGMWDLDAIFHNHNILSIPSILGVKIDNHKSNILNTIQITDLLQERYPNTKNIIILGGCRLINTIDRYHSLKQIPNIEDKLNLLYTEDIKHNPNSNINALEEQFKLRCIIPKEYQGEGGKYAMDQSIDPPGDKEKMMWDIYKLNG